MVYIGLRTKIYSAAFQCVNLSMYIEDTTQWRVDMNFMFEWQEQYLTSERSQRVMFFLSYRETNSTKAKGGNRDFIERYDTHKGDIREIRHSGPG